MAEMQKLEFTISANVDGAVSDLDRLKRKLREVNSAGSKKDGLRRTQREMRDTGKSASKLSAVLAALKRVTFYRAIRSAIKAVTSSFSEGLQNAYAFSQGLSDAVDRRIATALDSMSSSALKMKNQLGAAFGSLLTALAPLINTLLSWITAAANAITQLFAAFTGGTYLKAKDVSAQFADNMQRGAGAAKEWKNQLMGFDVINRLEEPSSGGRGGGSTAIDPSDMYEVAEIGGIFADIVQECQTLVEKWRELVNSLDFQPIISAWETLRTAVVGFATSILGSGISWIWENIFVPLASWTIQTAAPEVLKLIASAFDLLTAACKRLSPVFRWIWDNVLQPIAKFVADTFIETITAIRERIESLTSLINGDMSFRDWLNDLSPIEEVLLAIATAAAAVYTALGIYNGIAAVSALVTGGFSKALAFLAANPVLAVIAAIATLITIGIELYKNWDKIIEKLNEFKEKCAEAFGNGKLEWTDFAYAAIQAVSWIITKIQDLIAWIKGAIDWLNNLSFVKNANARAAAAQADGSIYLQGFASGGYPQGGQLFLARENGPELVGTMGGHTAVANNDQIVEGIKAGVFEAVSAAMSGNSNGQPVNIYLDGKEIARTTTKYQNQMARAGA